MEVALRRTVVNKRPGTSNTPGHFLGGEYGGLDCADRNTGGGVDSLFRLLNWLLILAAFSFGFANSQAQAASQPAVPWYAGCSMVTGGVWECQGHVTIHNPWTQDANSAGQKTVGSRNFYGQTQNPAWDMCTFTHVSGLSAFGNCTNGYVGGIGPIQRQYRCPEGVTGTVSGSECITDDPPPPDCEAKAGQTALEADFGDSDRDGELTPITCVEGCQAVLSSSSPGKLDCVFGGDVGTCSYTIHGKYMYSGDVCAGGEETPAPVPPDNPDCPQCECFEQGGSYGTVNGVETCVPQGTAGSAPVTTQQPPTTTTETPPPTPENPDPEPVTTTQPGRTVTVTPSPTGGAPIITETSTNSDGSTSTFSGSKDAYCRLNPNSSLCGDGADDSFGGSCSAGFSCDGDVISCAIAREQHKRNCELFENETPQSQLGEAMTEGTDDGASDNPARPENREIINIPDHLNATDGGVVGALQDVSIPFGTASITLPFGSLNQALDWMGLIVLAFGYFSAYRIVGGIK